MGRRGYPAEFRRRVLDLLHAGGSVASIAHDLQISDQTIYAWRRQDRIDRGEIPGLSTAAERSDRCRCSTDGSRRRDTCEKPSR
ncbi:transposase [Nesterenkonia sp. AY15]|uniref:transposase n=1 Tax=Nesterenkonia sp. AY15 TaxID=2901139 RepID=UPI00406C0559